MLWVFIVMLVATVTYRKEIRGDKKFFIFGLFLAAVLGLIIAHGNGINAPWRWSDTYYKTPLVSLRSADGVNGSLFLGTGSIQSTGYYFYYVREGEGYKLYKLSADNNVLIIEENRKDGELRRYVGEVIDPISWWWISVQFPRGYEKYEFRIPQGSLKQNFSVQ